MITNIEKLGNGLTVSVDWLSFTVFDMSLEDVVSLLGYTMPDFGKLPKGGHGYKCRIKLNGYDISVLYDGTPDMGIHVEVSGKSMGELLRSYKQTLLNKDCPFGECYDLDFDESCLSSLLSNIHSVGRVTRLDLAIDDIGGLYFSVKDVEDYYISGQVVSKLRGARSTHGLGMFSGIGHTLYFGSGKSDVMLRVYDKQAEMNRFLPDDSKIEFPWIRWELETKKDRAESISSMIRSGLSLGAVAVGVLGGYVRIINLDDSNRSRCSLLEKWRMFMSDMQVLKLRQIKYEKTLDEKREWVKRQVMPTLTAIILADGGSLEFVENNMEQGLNRMNQSLYDMAMGELDN